MRFVPEGAVTLNLVRHPFLLPHRLLIIPISPVAVVVTVGVVVVYRVILMGMLVADAAALGW